MIVCSATQIPHVISYDNLDDEAKRLFNLVFTEVRKDVETAFRRIKAWFPILGRNKQYWHYDEELLHLTVEASVKLHNWMMRKRELSYAAEVNPVNHYRDYY